MHLILLAVGTFMVIVGTVLMYRGVPLDEYGNSPFLMSGMVALVGGLLLLALSQVVRILSRIAERLEIQPMPLPPIADIPHLAPPPRPTAPPLVRSDFGTPAPEVAAPEVRVEPTVTLPAVARPEPAVAARVEPTVAPPLSRATPQPLNKSSLFGWLGKARAPGAAPSKGAPATPPAEPARADAQPSVPVAEREPAPKVAVAPPPSAGNGVTPPQAAAGADVYKSGVIDGMAYTLYTDGSIEAQLSQGPIRFASVEALQAYLIGK